ncbi:MAG: hypothetical protein Q8Q01_01395 [archaeon]|nr:hypothetical protein [archaeon]
MDNIVFETFRNVLIPRLFLSTEPYHKERSRGDGEMDLRNLVDQATHEGSWIFRERDNKWFNVSTRYLTFTRRGMDYGVGNVNVLPDISDWETVSHYHLHLKSREESAIKQKERIYAKRNLPIHYITNWEGIETVIPSKEDLKAYIEIEREFRETPDQKQKLEIDYRIVSPHGMIVIRNLQLGYNEDDLVKFYEHITYQQLKEKASIESKSEAIREAMKSIARSMDGICSVNFIERKR